MPEGLDAEVDAALARLEKAAGKDLGDSEDPLLVSVRSGARVSMPGMLDTVLNLGLNDDSVEGLAEAHRRPALRLGLLPAPGPDVRHRGPWRGLRRASRRRSGRRARTPAPARTPSWAPTGCGRSPSASRRSSRASRGGSSRRPPATSSSRRSRPSSTRGAGSGRGLLPAPEPDTGRLGDRGQRPADGVRQPRRGLRLGRRVQPRCDHRRAGTVGRLPRQRPGRGRRRRRPQHGAAGRARGADARGACAAGRSLTTLERHYRDMQDVEFTVEEGRSTSCRRGTRSGRRRPRCASRATRSAEGLLTKREALATIDAGSLDALLHPDLRPGAELRAAHPRGRRLAGRGQGSDRLQRREAVRRSAEGDDVILVRPFTEADDVAGFHAARGILTSEGGKSSHAALVARGMGRPCVCGPSRPRGGPRRGLVRVGDVELEEGTRSRSTARPGP